MYPPMIDPQLMRFQQMFGNMQGSGLMDPRDAPSIPFPTQMPQRLGATPPMAPMPEVIDPSLIGSEQIQEPPEMNIARRLQELYSPETAANERLTALLSQFPQRENPGVLAKIVGSLIGGARGPEAADRAMYGGHRRAVEDWENQVRPAEHLANQERYNNQNERQFANQVITSELNERKFGHKVENDAANLKIREKRAAAYDFKARNPNMQIKVDQKTGNLIGINPQTGQTQFITDADGKPVQGRELSFEDKQNILQENALERIDRAAEVGLNRGVTVKASPSYDDLHPEDKVLTPDQERTARLARIEALVAERPELSGWFEDTDGKEIKIRESYTPGWFGQALGKKADNPAIRKALVDHVIHGKPLVLPKEETPVEDKGPEGVINKNNGKLPEGKIKVISPDGVVGMIPMSRLDAYLKGGYKKAN